MAVVFCRLYTLLGYLCHKGTVVHILVVKKLICIASVTMEVSLCPITD